MSLRRLAGLGALCGAFVLAGWVAAGRLGSGLPSLENIPRSIERSGATPSSPAAEVIEPSQPTEIKKDTDDAANETASANARSIGRPPSSKVKVASTPDTSDPMQRGSPNPAIPSAEFGDTCLRVESCVDEYLWSLYQRAPKVDTIKTSDQINLTVKEKGKTHTVKRTIIKLIDEDFTWKDPNAAQRAAMPLKDYVIGGMDRSFKLKLYRALRAMDNAGLAPGITSAFRDDYRQSLASGNKAAVDSSYHGGSRRGGYGHGLAADLVSVKGETRAQRLIASESLWKWIDEHGPEFGIGRPYLDKDPPHVGPIDGQEFAEKRGQAILRSTAFHTSKGHRNAASDHIKTAQTSPAGEAPIGHRQPKLRHVFEVRQLSGRDRKMKELEEGLTKKLTGICRGC